MPDASQDYGKSSTVAEITKIFDPIAEILKMSSRGLVFRKISALVKIQKMFDPVAEI